eukprot:gene15398-20861_t
MATVGVLLTTGIFGIAAHFLLGLNYLQAILLGAIVGSTDAAAVFFLLRIGGINIRDRVRSALEVESGTNDPMAIFLAIALVELISNGSQTDGLVLTNAHVVKGASEVIVKLTDRREFRAKVLGSDPKTDVAVLKIDAKNLPTVRLGSTRDLQVGEWVLAIGSPF